jgi:hypothetical protein
MKDQIEVEQPRSTSNSLTSCREMTICLLRVISGH